MTAVAFAGVSLMARRPARAETLEGWPCAGCTTVVPAPRDAGPSAGVGPRPLLVALHGDGGATRPVVRAWKAAAEEAGAVLFVPACPRALGCTTASFWQWLASSGHDPAWLGAQIDAVTGRFPVDARRVYAAGYSGGATYLGWYAPTFPARFAAVAHVAGGAPYRPPCPSCKVPVLFVLGAGDPMLGPYTRPLRQWYEGCGGHEIVWETLPGVTHEGILHVLEAGRAKTVMAWLLAHEGACDAPKDAGADAADAAELVVEAAANEAGALLAPPSPPSPPREPPAPARCACTLERGDPTGEASAVAAFALLVARRRGRSARRRPGLSPRARGSTTMRRP